MALIVAGALFGGCGDSHSVDATTPTTAKAGRPSYAGKPSPSFPPQLHVCLDGRVDPANVAILTAVEKGFFDDVGLTVYPGSPIRARRPVRYVAAYTDDIALTQQPQAVIGKEKGAPIVSVGSLISQPTAALIWLKKSGVRGIADLKGKTIAVPGIPYQERMLEFILEKAGLKPDDVKVKHVGFRLVPALAKGEADAIFGGSWNLEGVALRKQGLKPVIKRVQELGVPAYDELVVITRADRAAREPQVIRKFMSALSRAVAALKRNPELAVKLIEGSGARYFEIGKTELQAQVRATVPLMSESGYVDPGQTTELLTWMHGEGMVERPPPASQLFTNRYLAGG